MAILRIAVFLLFYFSLCFSSFAFQFEKYEWGKPLKNMELKIKEKGKVLIPSDKDSELSYTDKILNEDCLVTLVFTPKTKELASVRILWNNKYVGDDVKKLLAKKYGKFYQPDIMSDEYRWKGSSQYDLIVLNYSYLAMRYLTNAGKGL